MPSWYSLRSGLPWHASHLVDTTTSPGFAIQESDVMQATAYESKTSIILHTLPTTEQNSTFIEFPKGDGIILQNSK